MSVGAGHRARLVISSAVGAGFLAQRISLPSSGVMTIAAGTGVPATPASSSSILFPVLGAAVSDEPGVKLVIHNFSQFTPVQPTLLNFDNTTFGTGAFSIVEPGGSVTSLGITNEIQSGNPTQQLKLALQNLTSVESGGCQLEVLAWQV